MGEFSSILSYHRLKKIFTIYYANVKGKEFLLLFLKLFRFLHMKMLIHASGTEAFETHDIFREILWNVVTDF